jgi:hypothetical protein
MDREALLLEEHRLWEHQGHNHLTLSVANMEGLVVCKSNTHPSPIRDIWVLQDSQIKLFILEVPLRII